MHGVIFYMSNQLSNKVVIFISIPRIDLMSKSKQ